MFLYEFLTILKQNKRDLVFHCKFEPLNVFLHRFFSFFVISSHILGFFWSFGDFVNYFCKMEGTKGRKTWTRCSGTKEIWKANMKGDMKGGALCGRHVRTGEEAQEGEREGPGGGQRGSRHCFNTPTVIGSVDFFAFGIICFVYFSSLRSDSAGWNINSFARKCNNRYQRKYYLLFCAILLLCPNVLGYARVMSRPPHSAPPSKDRY